MTNDPNLTGRSAWFADVRAILDIAERHPAWPLPRVYPGLAAFYFTGIPDADLRSGLVCEAQRELTAVFRCEFEPGTRFDGWREFGVIRATLRSGFAIDLVALVTEIGTRAPGLAEAGTVAA